MLRNRIVILIFVLMLALPIAAQADSYLRQVATIGPMEIMGEQQPAQSDTSIAWLSSDKAYSESSQGITVTRFDLGMIYMIDHNSKSYSEISLDALANFTTMMEEIAGEDEELSQIMEEIKENGTSETLQEDLAELRAEDPEMAQMAEQMVQLMLGGGDQMQSMVSVTVDETSETKHIGPWSCRKYLVTMTMPMIDKMTSEIWATEEIDINYDELMQTSMGLLANWPGFMDAMAEFKKVRGMSVYSTATMSLMGIEMDITTELVEHSESDPPAGIYNIPDGYTKVDFGAVPGAY